MRSKLDSNDYISVHELAKKNLTFSYIAHQHRISENYVRVIHKIFTDVAENNSLSRYLMDHYPSIIKTAQQFYSKNVENSNKTKSDPNVSIVIQLLEENNRLLRELLLK